MADGLSPSDTGSRWRRLTLRRDFYAGALMLLLGLVVAMTGLTYDLGTLTKMGPGFFPTVLGVLLVLLGIAIAGSAGAAGGASGSILPKQPEWRGWGCILASPLLFMLFSRVGGLLPAAFSCVFVAALGDRGSTVKSAFVLALLVSLVGVGLFSYLLQVSMPVLTWRGL